MDSSTFVYAGLTAVLIVVVVLIYYNVRASKRYLPGDRQQEQAFKSWLKENGYAFDHFHFYRATGIAFSNGEARLAVFNSNVPSFFRKDELGRISSREEVSGRMVAAAPGVVRQVNTTLYVLDVGLKDASEPAGRIMFLNEKQRSAWEKRLQVGVKAVAGQKS